MEGSARLHRSMSAEAKPSATRDKLRDSFLEKCHRAMEKGKPTQDKFAEFVAQYCHEAGTRGSACVDDMPFSTLPQDVQVQFVVGTCPSDPEERLGCLQSMIAAGETFEFRGNIDELCVSTYPLMTSTSLILVCKESRYYNLESITIKSFTNRLCSEPSLDATRPSLEPSKKRDGNEVNLGDTTSGKGSGQDKASTNETKEKGSKGSIQSKVPTKAPVVEATPTVSQTQPSPVKRVPSARPNTVSPTVPPTKLPTAPVKKPSFTKAPYVASLLPTMSPVLSRASGNSSSTLSNLPTQNENPPLPLHSITGKMALAGGVLCMTAVLVSLLVRRRNRRKPHRHDDPALYVDASISSERSSVYNTESFAGGMPEGIGAQPKKIINLGKLSPVGSIRERAPPSADKLRDQEGGFRWNDPRSYMRTIFGGKAPITPKTNQDSFCFPSSSPYLVEERNVNPRNEIKRTTMAVFLSRENRKQEQRQMFKPMSSLVASAQIDSPRRKRRSKAALGGAETAPTSGKPFSGRVPSDIEVEDSRPWRLRKNRPYTALGDESDGYSDNCVSSTRMALPTAVLRPSDASDEESLGSLAFLSPEMLKQFQDVDHRLSEGFKEFNEVDDRISLEFHKIESSLEKACEVDIQNSSPEETAAMSFSRQLSALECETSSGPLDSSTLSRLENGFTEPDLEDLHCIEDKANDDCSVDSDKEVYEFSHLRDHFANSWYRKPGEDEHTMPNLKDVPLVPFHPSPH